MVDATDTFFHELARREHEPLLETAEGAGRFDIFEGRELSEETNFTESLSVPSGARTEHWRLTMRRGDISLSRDSAPADCYIRTSRDVFNGILTGQLHAVAAVFRGLVAVEGRPDLLVLIQRLFPAAPSTGAPVSARQDGSGAER